MNQEGLKSCHVRRRQKSLTDSRTSRGKGYENLTKDLVIDSPMQVLSSDISYIRTGEGFDYLCQLRDVFTNTVLASTQDKTMKADLVLRTITQAEQRWTIPDRVIMHSDRVAQYTAKEVQEQIKAYGWRQSYSRVGTPGDNAWSESFFSILKKEIVHWKFYPTRELARQAVFEYIEFFYNRVRAQKRLGYISPIEFLENWVKSQSIKTA
jgi:putative transposase